MKAFADLYRKLDAATSTRSKQAALVDYFSQACAEPASWSSAAWAAYFLAGGKPRQVVSTRLLRRLAIEGGEVPEWLFDECYQSVGDLAETLTLLLPDYHPGEPLSLADWMRSRLLPMRSLGDDEKFARLRSWSREIGSDECFVLFKLITGGLRVGVSRLQIVKALAYVAQVDEAQMAQRMMGYAATGRILEAKDFAALIGEVGGIEAQALEQGRPYPFCLAQSWQRPLDEMPAVLGESRHWQVEWKFDGIRAQLIRRAPGWRLWSRGEDLISESYPEFGALAEALPVGVALDGEIVVTRAGDHAGIMDIAGIAPFASLQQRLGRKTISEKTRQELPVAFIAYDALEWEGIDIRARPQRDRRALLETIVAAALDHAPAAPLILSPLVTGADWSALAAERERARSLGFEGLMLKAREGVYGVGRRKGSDRTDVWWKWKLDPMSIDAVLIYAQRGHGRRSGLYSDYTFAVWSDQEGAPQRTLVPFAKAYSGLTDAEMRAVDAIVRRTTLETFGPVSSVTPTLVFELGFEGIGASRRHKSGIAVRFPRMLRWRRDKPVAEADTLGQLRALLPVHADG